MFLFPHVDHLQEYFLTLFSVTDSCKNEMKATDPRPRNIHIKVIKTTLNAIDIWIFVYT